MKLLFAQLFIVVFLCSSLIQGKQSDQEYQRNTAKIAECTCTKNKKGAAFHDCIAKCQKINPYNMKNNVDPNELARKKIYGKGKLDQEVRSKICQNDKSIEDFIEELKVQVGEHKTTVRSDCNNEEKLTKCYEDKQKCYIKCCKEHDEWK